MIRTVKTNLIWFALITIVSFPLKGNDRTSSYIDQYKTIVLNEMERTGIPASIKMAQAILESGSGQSTLAKQSNNHFGIKCGNSWKGKEVYRHDDDYKNGLLVRSCFRAYDRPEDSFMAHSDFLMKNRRYAFLFKLDRYDYKAWARGLRKAGYATDPNYPSKLINLIEKYQLDLLDLGIPPEEQLIASNKDRSEKPSSEDHKTPKIVRNPVVIAQAGSARPATNYALNKGYYRFKDSDTMADVAAHFNMDVKELYFKNRLPYGSTPKSGELLSIRSYINFKKLPETISSETADTDYLFEEVITLSSL